MQNAHRQIVHTQMVNGNKKSTEQYSTSANDLHLYHTSRRALYKLTWDQTTELKQLSSDYALQNNQGLRVLRQRTEPT